MTLVSSTEMGILKEMIRPTVKKISVKKVIKTSISYPEPSSDVYQSVI